MLQNENGKNTIEKIFGKEALAFITELRGKANEKIQEGKKKNIKFTSVLISVSPKFFYKMIDNLNTKLENYPKLDDKK